MMTKTMTIHGMAGQKDADRVTAALHEVWGIHKAEVNLVRQEVTFSYDEAAATLRDFQEAVLEQGFEVSTGEGVIRETLHDRYVEAKAGESTDANDL